jgi:hypothetical protein
MLMVKEGENGKHIYETMQGFRVRHLFSAGQEIDDHTLLNLLSSLLMI